MSKNKFMEHRQFVLNIEHAIKLANREVINQMVLPINEEKVLAISVEVAKARGAYLEAVVKINAIDKDPSELRNLRETYEEMRDGFAALMTVFDRDYVDLPSPGQGSGAAPDPDARAA